MADYLLVLQDHEQDLQSSFASPDDYCCLCPTAPATSTKSYQTQSRQHRSRHQMQQAVDSLLHALSTAWKGHAEMGLSSWVPFASRCFVTLSGMVKSNFYNVKREALTTSCARNLGNQDRPLNLDVGSSGNLNSRFHLSNPHFSPRLWFLISDTPSRARINRQSWTSSLSLYM